MNDAAIAKKARLKDIEKIAEKWGIRKRYVEPWGQFKAKIRLEFLDSVAKRRNGKYIVVTAITPTPLGEGKTVTSIGLSMALNRLGRKSVVCLRQPSMGPIFGAKGSGTGGGFAQILPREGINLHFTGDFHAVEAAHNLLAAFIENNLFRGNRSNIDLKSIFWRRVLDVNDRSLRQIRIGRGEKTELPARYSGFDITVASEVMAILALSKDIADMRKRLGSIVVAMTRDGKPVTATDLQVAGAMAAILRDAIKPNLVQTIEGTPCFVHTGPFANIAHGNSSILADMMARKIADYVITESGFGADLGCEKFFDIKCRASGLTADIALIVCSIRALKMHSGQFEVKGSSLDKRIYRENLRALEIGCENLKWQIKNIRSFGIPVVVAINRFATDTEREIELVRKRSLANGADRAEVSEVWKRGSRGGLELARAIMENSRSSKTDFRFLYPIDISVKDKIEIIAKRMYGAGKINYSDMAAKKIKIYERLGFRNLPICIAKTHLSLSSNPELKGVPKGFSLRVRDISLSAGAGFLTPICGAIHKMPGLPLEPVGTKIDIDSKGNIIGLI